MRANAGVAIAATLLFAAGTAQAETFTVTQQGKQFDIKEISLAVGDSITFTNADEYTHNIYSKSKVQKFNLGKQEPGASDAITFDNAGKVKVRCAIHPKMKLKVTVQ